MFISISKKNENTENNITYFCSYKEIIDKLCEENIISNKYLEYENFCN